MWLVVLVFALLWPFYGERLLLSADCLLCYNQYIWSCWFSLITLNFYGERLLFVVCCWLWCDCYIWSCWFSLCLAWIPAISPFWRHSCWMRDLYGWSYRFFVVCSLKCDGLLLLCVMIYLVPLVILVINFFFRSFLGLCNGKYIELFWSGSAKTWSGRIARETFRFIHYKAFCGSGILGH